MAVNASVSPGVDTPTPGAMLLTAKDVAAALRVSIRTLYRLKDSHSIPLPQKIAGSKLARWNRAEIEQWIKDGMPSCRAAAKGGAR